MGGGLFDGTLMVGVGQNLSPVSAPADLQHAVPVVGLAELVLLLRAPGVGARAPATTGSQYT